MYLFSLRRSLKHQFIRNPLNKKYLKLTLSAFLFIPIHAQASVNLVYPAVNENVTTNNPEFVWQDQASATNFQVQVRDITGRVTTSESWLRSEVCDGTTCRSTVSGVDLQHPNRYWWRARVRTSSGWQAWTSPVSRFRYPDSPAGDIAVSSPVGTGTESNPSFSWSHIEGVTHYRLWARDYVTNQRLILQNYLSADVCSNGTCAVDAGLDFSVDDDVDHQWMIRALNSGGWNDWSQRYKFRIGSASSGEIPSDADVDNITVPWCREQTGAIWGYANGASCIGGAMLACPADATINANGLGWHASTDTCYSVVAVDNNGIPSDADVDNITVPWCREQAGVIWGYANGASCIGGAMLACPADANINANGLGWHTSTDTCYSVKDDTVSPGNCPSGLSDPGCVLRVADPSSFSSSGVTAQIDDFNQDTSRDDSGYRTRCLVSHYSYADPTDPLIGFLHCSMWMAI